MKTIRTRATMGSLDLVLTNNRAGTTDHWSIQMFRGRSRRGGVACQTLFYAGAPDGAVPRFREPDAPDESHSIWLGSACVEVPQKTWAALKAWHERACAEAEASVGTPA